MIVTFKSKASANISMQGDTAIRLIKMTGHSGSVPGAILAAHTALALNHLQSALQHRPDETVDDTDNDGEAEVHVSLKVRAFPLIQMLENAARQDCDVMWDQGF